MNFSFISYAWHDFKAKEQINMSSILLQISVKNHVNQPNAKPKNKYDNNPMHTSTHTYTSRDTHDNRN